MADAYLKSLELHGLMDLMQAQRRQVDIEGYDEDAILTYDYDDDDRYSEYDEE